MATALARVRQKFFDEGHLEAEQFDQLQELQDDETPYFVEDAFKSYYADSNEQIKNIDQALKKNRLDFGDLASRIDHLKGSSMSIGAGKVIAGCNGFKEYCIAGNGDGCKTAFKQLKEDRIALTKKLKAYFKIENKARSSSAAP